MSIVIGIALGLASAALASALKLQLRTFYATVLIATVTYYVLFAVLAGAMRATIIESLVVVAFALAGGVGFKVNPWLIVGGFAAHGAFDLVHGLLISNPGVPAWWPPFCMAYDVAAAAALAWSLLRLRASEPRPSGAPPA